MDVNLTWKHTHIPSLNWHGVCSCCPRCRLLHGQQHVCVRHNNETTTKKATNKMCTQLLNMKRTHYTNTHTHTHSRTHTHGHTRPTEAACVAAKWLLLRSGPVDRRIAAVPSRVPARPQRIRARARSVPRPGPTLHMYLYLHLNLYPLLHLCAVTSALPSRRREVNLNGRRLIPDLFLSTASSFRFLFLNSLYDPLISNMPRACASDENNRPISP